MEKSLVKKILIISAASIVLYWALVNHTILISLGRRLLSVVGPLIAGGAIAFILNVPVRALEKRVFTKGKSGVRRVLSIILTFLLVLIVVALLLLIVIPELVVAIEQLATSFPSFIDSTRAWGESLGERLPELGFWLEELDISWGNMKSEILDFLKRSSTALVGSTVGLASSVISGVVNFILGLVFSVYMLARKEQLARQFKRLLFAYVEQEKGKKIVHAAHLVNTTFSKFVAGACTEAVILGLMFLVSMLIFRFPYAVLVAALVSVSALIPIVGAFIAAIVGALLMLVSNPMQALWFLVLFLVLQQIEGNLIYPRVVGDSIGLPALWVLAAVMVGGNLFGVLGMLAGVPFAAVVYVLVRESVGERLARKKVTDEGD
ncbi:AI-2E family transporter [Pleomorphochaeta sp. DL1XJH-081]|uniref:AI-2E family transporter n=1 Tax=Pleomorphochaeta sp. DL1XJH-081 TaxID=3409690 RepID=UPI003BB52D5C